MSEHLDLEQQLRDTLSARLATLQPQGDLNNAVQHRLKRTRRQRGLVFSAAAILLLAGFWTIAVNGADSSRQTLTDDSPATPPAPAPGQQAVSFHGLQVLVPASWSINALRCGTPIADTVVFDDSDLQTCALTERPDVTAVHLAVLDTPVGKEYAALATQSTSVDGQAAWRGSGHLTPTDDTLYQVLVVPSRGAVVAIGAPSPPPSALLDDVHVVTVDTNGCTQQVTALAPAPPTRDGANAQLLPPGATSIGLCRYLNGWMVRSAMVTGSTLGSFEAGVNSSPSRPQGPVGGTCADGESIVLHASYASGPPVQLLAELSGCPYSLSNGAITHGLSRALVTALIDPVGWSGSLGDLTQLPPA